MRSAGQRSTAGPGSSRRASRSFSIAAPRHAVLLAAVLCGCAPLDPPALRTGEDAIDVVHRGSFASASPGTRTAASLPTNAHRRRWFPWFQSHPVPRAFPPLDLIDPGLKLRIASPLPGARETLFVTFYDTLRVGPIGYWPVPGTKRDSAYGITADSLVLTATGLIQGIEARRFLRYEKDSIDLVTNYGATILKKYWLVQGFLVDMPQELVDSLSRRDSILYIRPNRGNPPPQAFRDTFPGNDVEASAQQMGARHYRDVLGLTGEWTALLDTGVETEHDLLCGSSSSICLMADAMSGDGMQTANFTCNRGPGCVAPYGNDFTKHGHGTQSAAILVGNESYSGRYRGLTSASLDCIRVYDSTQVSSTAAAVDAYELATRRLNRVMAVELQERTLGDIAVTTRNAFDAGVAIIAANGNDNAYVTTTPASERLAIGVGAYDVMNGEVVRIFSAGRTADLRNKPDLIGPTFTETAAYDRTNATVKIGIAGGTSGSTPYAAGAASLLSDWLRIGSPQTRDPGQVYSLMMLSGDKTGPFRDTCRAGVGPVKLPTTGEAVWGKTWVSWNAPTVEIPITVTSTASNPVKRIEAAIWWPEKTEMQGATPVDTHSDVDLSLHAPGVLSPRVAKSDGTFGVFERLVHEKTTGLQSGTWKLKIHGYSILRPPQIVYWSLRQK